MTSDDDPAGGGRAWKLLNYGLLQAAWFGCVLPAAAGHIALAWVAGVTAIAVHFALVRDRRADAWLVAAALVVGAVTETAARGLGAYDVPLDPIPAPFVPSWMLLLWAVFGTSVRHCMGWLRGRLLLAAALGAVGGPLSLLGGAELGAVTTSSDVARLWLVVGAQWAIALPTLVWCAAKIAAPTAPAASLVATSNPS